METTTQLTANDTKQLVLSFIDALNNEDFDTAREYLNNDFTFKGVMGSRDGADVYMEDMKKMKFKYKVNKTVADEQDVSLLYDFTQGDITLPGCAWYHIENSEIASLNVIFDPRPLLKPEDKK